MRPLVAASMSDDCCADRRLEVLNNVETSPYWMRIKSGPHEEGMEHWLRFMSGYKPDLSKYRLRVLDGCSGDVYVKRVLLNCTALAVSGPLSVFEAIIWDLPACASLTLELVMKRDVEKLVVMLEDAP